MRSLPLRIFNLSKSQRKSREGNQKTGECEQRMYQDVYTQKTIPKLEIKCICSELTW